ncbi:aquaporin family protein [Candidatus Purcelliella pentastirinorum]|nr:MIP/aquaporin family protein [Candidatus Purcelliella pentastirinorum]WDI78841.1 aquaporin family protein [Candidatus Purcelliella pentastirinorum]WDR79974.1 aquaporin family protein [Candidatus Purcelliella pentastirinorum]
MNKKIDSNLRGRCIAEFLGTGLIIFFITGSCAALKLTGANFGQWEISIISGMGVTMAIYISNTISGSHLNPAVTIALWMHSYFKKRDVIPYILSQICGAFFATALIYCLYYNLFINFELKHHLIKGSKDWIYLASIFSTYPNSYINIYQAFVIETIITIIFMTIIMILTDNNYNENLSPLIIGLLIGVIGSSVGTLTSFALNPARDFAPKLFTWLIGWGNIVFTGGRKIPYFLIPIFGPILGANIGVFSYKKYIKPHLHKQE